MPNFITYNLIVVKEKYRRIFSPVVFVILCCGGLFLLSSSTVTAQKISVITPDKTAYSQSFAAKLEDSLAEKFRITDSDLSETVFNSADFETPFNLTTTEAKNLGAAIGSDYIIIIKADNLRRFAIPKREYYESFAAVFVISSRTGRLIFWKLQRAEDETAAKADVKLFDSTTQLSKEIFDKIKITGQAESTEKTNNNIAEMPDENSAEAKNLRPPLPYLRIKPKYTQTAFIYGITATVDVEVEFDAVGKVLKTEVIRWAGYGLDESVIEAVLKMQWRPADRNGKTLPMRVLLRYNFKKVEE